MHTTFEPRTPQEWAAWLAEQEQRTLRLYSEHSDRLISEGRSERQVAGDYAGREILELLQNANDAAADAEMRGRVRIELSPAGLLVANQGAQFTSEGVRSLKLAHLSPKRGRKRQMVGDKGLGFRAVLNWTHTPLVLSEGLALAFSLTAARALQDRLAASNEELRSLIAEEEQNGGPLVVPLLAFPGFDAEGDVAELLDNAEQQALYARARELREAGFTTVIAMPFDGSEAPIAQARKQLAQLRPEVLLFARNIAVLEIAETGKPPLRWVHELAGLEASRVHVSETEMCEWRVFRRDGEVPKKLCPPDRPTGMDYEVVVAVPTDHEAQEGVLYSYFPTEMSFPYPVVAHATLDLQANRQQPQDTKANHFIFRCLARCLAEAAQTLARQHNNDRGLLLLSMRALADPLAKFHFRKSLRRLARQCQLVPTAAAGLVKARAARRTKFVDNAWLPKRSFTNVARVTDSRAAAVLEWMNVDELSSVDWIRLTVKLEFESIAERANYIVGLVRHQVSDAIGGGGLLLDGEGRPVPSGCKVFVGDAARRDFKLPEWFDARFLLEDLRIALMERLQPQRQEQFIALLAPFEVASYSLTGVLESLSAQGRRRTEAEPERADEVRRELLVALHTLFPADEPRETRVQFPRSTVFLQTLAGTYEPARKIYLSESYGPRGRILQDLYGTFAPQKLLASAEANGLSGEGETLAKFFQWLGVADAPLRESLAKNDVEEEFVVHVQQRLSYPLWIDGFSFNKATDFRGYCIDVVSVDELPNVLKHASSSAVLAWLAADARTQSWKALSPEHGKLHYAPGGRYNIRHYEGSIASYVRWKLQSTPWLQTRDGYFRPSDCVMESIPALSKLLPTPAFPSSQELSRYGISRGHLYTAWDNAGVLPGLSYLEADQLYELLGSLPKRDPGGEVAKSVYEAVLRRFTEAEVQQSEGRKRWIREGKILARDGNGIGFFDIQKVWRLGPHELPPAVRRLIPVAEISKSVAGAEKVEALLGVRSVKAGQIVRHITGCTQSADADAAMSDFEELKLLIGYLRKTERARRALERMSLKLCSAITGDVQFMDHLVSLELGVWGWVLDDKSDTAYLRTDPTVDDPLGSPFFAHAVGEIFADVFGLESGAEFAQLAQCRRREDRVLLLSKLLGDETVPGLEELKQKLRERTAREQEMVVPAEGLLPPTVLQAPQGPVLPPKPIAAAAEPPADGPLQIQPVTHKPTIAATIALRVTRTVHVDTPSPTPYERVRGDFWEAKAMEFEAHTGRFPLHVGRIMGWNGPRVDIVSFNSIEQRAAFQSADRKDPNLVARFIEVKGRRDGGAKIDLRDNELDAARAFGDRYYIYRVTDAGDGEYALAMLRDPINSPGAAKRFYQVDFESAATTDRVNLIGGRSEAGYLRELDAAAGRPSPARADNPTPHSQPPSGCVPSGDVV